MSTFTEALVDTALEKAAATAAKTTFNAACDTFGAALATFLDAGSVSTQVFAQLESEFIDLIERVGDHAPTS